MAGIQTFVFVCGGLLLLASLTVEGKEKKGDHEHGGKPSAKLGSRKAPDDKIKEIVAKLEPDIRAKICGIPDAPCGSEYTMKVQGYKKQVVSGNNYFTSVSLKDKYYHVRIFEQTWTDTLEVVDVIGPKAPTDEIRYF